MFQSDEGATFITGQVLVVDGGLSGRTYRHGRACANE